MDDLNPDDLPKILLCGPHRAGKTSILKVVFQKMSPHETLFLESTPKVDILQISRNALVRFNIMDFPGSEQFNEQTNPAIFASTGALVFVIDAQDEPYVETIASAKKVIELAHRHNPKICFDVLIHKVDGDQFFSEDHKTEIQREIQQKLSDELGDSVDAQIFYHCTSIYDHSLYEALSKVVQKLIPEKLPHLQQSLDQLINNSRMEKAYLFDVVSKIYIASDSQPVDLQSYELCADMIDVVIDISCIYGVGEEARTSIQNSMSGDANCVIHLHSGRLLYLREVDKCLALVCILREDNFDRQHLLEHNIKVFKEALGEIFSVKDLKKSEPEPAGPEA